MKLSTRGRYAVRAMLDLALHASEGPVPRADIARRQQISADYIAHLLHHLQKAGLVRSRKGPSGGYLLGKDPDQITVGEIVQAAEGAIALAPCLEPGGHLICAQVEECVARQLWRKVSMVLVETLNSITLGDLCAQAQERHVANRLK